MAPSFYLFFILSLLLSFLHSSYSHTISLSLTPISIIPHSPWLKTLNYLTTSSLARAHHLKNPKLNSSSYSTNIPLYPQSYGGYSISLRFGSPAQKLSFVMDTGSSLVWFPCTHRYQCTNCEFPNIDQKNIPRFIPKNSSSSKIIGCSNRKCGWVFGSTDPIQCKGDDKEMCPAYMIQYGSGSTAGLMLSETLDFPEGDVTDFVVGCSILSTRQPSGIAGFGRGPASLPVQMGLKKFSYCLVSHRFDDEPVSSDFVLDRNSNQKQNSSNSGPGKAGMNYTRFHKNPVSSSSSFQDYYYVNLRKITVGGKTVKIPYGFLVPGSDGNGGTIIDSGTTFTFMDDRVYGLVAKAFEDQMVKFKRSGAVERESGLRPCFDIGRKPAEIPELVFHFKGGAKLLLPLADYFSFVNEADVVCMTIVSSKAVGSGTRIGPSIIIGNYQQQNIYFEYDLEKGRLGFKKQICK